MRVKVVAPPWFCVPPDGYGGIEWVASILADGLVEAGHDVTLVASGGSRTTGSLQTIFDPPPSRWIGDTGIELVHATSAYEDRDDYDVVHDHCGVTGPALAATLDGPPVVHTLHGPWTPTGRIFYRHVARKVNLVAISRDQARRAPDDIPIAGVVHNAIPLGLYPFSQDKDDFLLYVGRSNREKGPETAVEVARTLGRRLVMVIKVNEDAERDYFDAEVRPRMRGTDVEVRTQVTNEEKSELMARAACVVFPAQWPEPFGLVPAEANACGTPVAAYADGAVPEVVVEGETGCLAARGDVGGLSQAVERATGISPAACRRNVEERFSPPQMVDGYLGVYRRLLDNAA